MKPILQSLVVSLATIGGLIVASKVAGVDKMRQGFTAIGNKLVGDRIRGGAQKASGFIADKASASANPLANLAGRVATGNLGYNGKSRMAMQGQAYAEEKGKRLGAVATYEQNAGSGVRLDAGKMRGMKLEQVPGMKAASLTFVGERDDATGAAARSVYREALSNDAVRSKLKGDQRDAMLGLVAGAHLGVMARDLPTLSPAQMASLLAASGQDNTQGRAVRAVMQQALGRRDITDALDAADLAAMRAATSATYTGGSLPDQDDLRNFRRV